MVSRARRRLPHAALLASAVTSMTLLSAGPAHADGSHDPGEFFMRLSGGVGFGSAAFDDDGETTLAGVGGLISFAFGATVVQNLAIGVDLFGISMFEPNVKSGGEDLGDASGVRATIGGVGAGLTYYIMPVNLYLAASAGIGLGTFEFRGRFGNFEVSREDNTKVGFAANVMVGKEWWLDNEWGLGVALQAVISSLKTEADVGMGVFGVGLLFSATMN